MDEKVEDRHFVASLTDKEYIKLRVDVATKCMKLKDWIAEAVLEKLNKIEEK